MSEPLYPIYYGTERVTMADLQRRFGPGMEPEFARRLWAWLESEGGRIGIGSGQRSTAYALKLWLSNPLRYANPINSWHTTKKFGDGHEGYAAVDLVVRVQGQKHRSPTWLEGDPAKRYGLHAFIRRAPGSRSPEPWHLQAIIESFGFTSYGEGVQTRSASAWRAAGRPSFGLWQLPTGPTPPKPPTTGGTVINVTVTTIKKGTTEIGWTRKLQALLNTFGQNVVEDGDFGNQTDKALRNVQAYLGLLADGECGPKTWGVLMNLAPAA